MKVLVFTSLFPNNIERTKGIFIKERMSAVANYCDIKVVAPVPYFPSIKIFKQWHNYSQIKEIEEMDGLEIYHPRFFVIPKIGRIFHGLFMFLSILLPVAKIKKKFDFDLIDAHFVYPDGFAAVLLAKFFRKKVIVSARGTDINLFPDFFLIKREIVYALKKASCIISVSQALKEQMIKLNIPNNKIQVIPNGVDIEKFKAIPKIKAREYLGLPRDKKIILSVGHLVEGKGFQYLIGALHELFNKGITNPLPYLVIVGEGKYRSKLEEKISELNLGTYVKLAGAQPHNELNRWYSAADLFCLASSREGWPNVIFESLACGTPVVAIGIGGNPEVLFSDEYGILVNKQESTLLAEAIVKGLNKKWNYQKIINYAQQNTWDKIAQQVYRIFLSTYKMKSGGINI